MHGFWQKIWKRDECQKPRMWKVSLWVCHMRVVWRATSKGGQTTFLMGWVYLWTELCAKKVQYLRIFELDFQETPPQKIECGLNIPNGISWINFKTWKNFFHFGDVIIFGLEENFDSNTSENFGSTALEIFQVLKLIHKIPLVVFNPHSIFWGGVSWDLGSKILKYWTFLAHNLVHK